MGVDSAVFRSFPEAERVRARERLGLPLAARIVLHVGTCDPYKNVNGVLKIVARSREEVPGVLLVKVGEPFRPENRCVIEASAMGAATRCLGHLDVTALVDAYNAADVLLFPSLYEGFGLPVLEAMACGTPVLTSCTASLPEVAGEAAILCDPGDDAGGARALVRLLRDEKARLRLRERGLRRAGELGWERTAERTLECYCCVAQGERYKENAAASCDRPRESDECRARP